jgi:hypothetical protein
MLREFADHFNKKLDVTVTSSSNAAILSSKSPVAITIPHSQLAKANQAVALVNRDKNASNSQIVKGMLSSLYPAEFGHFKGFRRGYTPGALANVLGHKDIETQLDDQDRHALEDFIPKYLSSVQTTLKSKKKLKIIFDSIDAANTVYWAQVVKEFNRKLKAQVKTEKSWQDFLSAHILLLRSSYGEVLEKDSVSLQGKYPDFMLIDPYSYLDVYEIKTPYTQLLNLDKGRNNYYWNSELSKSISQTENYLHQIQRNSDTFITDIRRGKGLDISVVRPRGYIIAGLRSQLSTTKMADDFRILNESLKNIDIILYDDLLSNLEGFAQRISGI